MMRSASTVLLFGIALGLPSIGFSEDKTKDTTKAEAAAVKGVSGKSVTLTCSSGGDKRVIVTDAKEGGGCDVTYTKDGQSQPVASARNEIEYCDGVVQKMKSTLEGAGFKCE